MPSRTLPYVYKVTLLDTMRYRRVPRIREVCGLHTAFTHNSEPLHLKPYKKQAKSNARYAEVISGCARRERGNLFVILLISPSSYPESINGAGMISLEEDISAVLMVTAQNRLSRSDR
ncbi:hypothetical protein EYC84_004088 [Monilinia fructicola]|uniref:Uncharacterized protein n=1 Tax=Monilinia fructicola TaxID=38448 RepID=A0A5M9JZ65_MONFR|nr:hypothetical protein EYC84_004088 [Monilinia fructicola]